jgi:hypothetical protein
MNRAIEETDVRIAHLKYLSYLNQYEQCKNVNWITSLNEANIPFANVQREIILRANYLSAMKNYKNVMRKFQRIKFLEMYPPAPKMPKQKVLSKKEAQSKTEDVCSICLEYHAKIDTVMTSCGHRFGLVCFNQWKNTPPHNQITKCPLCKQHVLKTCVFINRKTTVQNKIINVID